MDMQAAIKQLQETAIVMAGIQARQAEAIKDHAEWLQAHDRAMLELDARMVRHERNLDRIELGLAEATDKLNALIDIVDRRNKNL